MSMIKAAELAPVGAEQPAPKHRPVELFATVALAILTLVAVTTVSIGIARADVFGGHGDAEAAPLALALFIGLFLSGMGGLTALAAGDCGRRD